MGRKRIRNVVVEDNYVVWLVNSEDDNESVSYIIFHDAYLSAIAQSTLKHCRVTIKKYYAKEDCLYPDKGYKPLTFKDGKYIANRKEVEQ